MIENEVRVLPYEMAKPLALKFLKMLKKQGKPIPETNEEIWEQFSKYFQENRDKFNKDQDLLLWRVFRMKGLLKA